MPNSPNPTNKIQRTREDVKSFLYNRILEEEFTQEYVAFLLGKAPQTLNHYLNPNDNQDFPAYLICFLPEPLACELLRFLADKVQCDLLPKIPVKGTVNGSTDDEMLNLDVLQGRFIESLRSDEVAPEKIRRIVQKMKEQLAIVEAELKVREAI